MASPPSKADRVATLVRLRTQGLATPAALEQAREKWSLTRRRFAALDREARQLIQLAAAVDPSDELALSIAQRRDFLQRAIAEGNWRLAEQIRERLDRQLRIDQQPPTPGGPDRSPDAQTLAAVAGHLAPLFPNNEATPEDLARLAALELVRLRSEKP